MSSNNTKILFLFFDSLFSIGGHTKNFLNLIKHIESEIKNNNFDAYIISFNNAPNQKAEDLRKISHTAFLKTYEIKILKRIFPSGKAVFQLIEYILNFIKTTLFILMVRPDIVYAYAEKPLYLTFPLKKIFRFRLIYDMRGDILDELKERGASKRYISILSNIHTRALKSVDLAFSVSGSYNINSGLKFTPKYNYYDGEIFKYNESKMLEKKKELKLEGKFVFVYTGNMHYYQFLNETAKFFRQFLEKHIDSFFIIITEHDSSEFISLITKYNIPKSNYVMKSLPQDEIASLQQVADIGFLMRENLPLNHHSFPTKFAEYLASGVPVLMTPHIHSIAPMVAQNGLGEVIEIKDDYCDEIDNIYSKYKNNLQIKDHCSQFAKKELMWQKKAVSIFDIIKNI